MRMNNAGVYEAVTRLERVNGAGIHFAGLFWTPKRLFNFQLTGSDRCLGEDLIQKWRYLWPQIVVIIFLCATCHTTPLFNSVAGIAKNARRRIWHRPFHFNGWDSIPDKGEPPLQKSHLELSAFSWLKKRQSLLSRYTCSCVGTCRLFCMSFPIMFLLTTCGNICTSNP